MWDTLYSDIILPDSLRGLYQLTQDMLEFTGMALDEMNDSLTPPPAAFPIHMDSTASPTRPLSILTSTTAPHIRKLPQCPHSSCRLIDVL